MPIFNNILAGASGQGDTGYDIEQSLRFNDDDSPILSRTPSSASNQKTWTWSGWIKRSNLGAYTNFFDAHTDDSNRLYLAFNASDKLEIYGSNSGSNILVLTTSAVYRDCSAFYHIAFQCDTTQASSSNRAKLYVNGEQVTAFDTATYPAQDTDLHVNSTAVHRISSYAGTSNYLDGYLAEVNFIDGTALDASSFGETNSDTNQWVPIEYVGSYGTNGFYLPFSSTELANSFSNDTYSDAFVPSSNLTVNYLVVAGGGSGGAGDKHNYGGGGGGAGGLLSGSTSVTSGTSYPITVGAGGAAIAPSNSSGAAGNNGSNSVFSSFTAIGGGGGSYASTAAKDGGSGGGGGGGQHAGGDGTSGQGNDGGDADNYQGAGGGGAGGAGQTRSGTTAGAGGSGVDHSGTFGTSYGVSGVFAGGGGGGYNTYGGQGTAPGAGGSGGGGAGGTIPSPPDTVKGTDGTANTGGGGGGGSSYHSGSTSSSDGGSGAGGSGVVLIRYAGSSPQATGGTISTVNISGTDYQVHAFTNLYTDHTITANGDVTNTRAQKKIGSSSIKFDGTGDYLEMPDSSDWDFGSGSWTVEGWFNVSSWTDSSFIWNHWQDDNNFVGIRVLTGGDLNILSKSSGSVVHNIDFTSVDLPTDTWVHLAVVRDTSAGNFVIYKDGTSVGSSSNSTAMPNVTGTARINGGRVYGNYWTGYLDEFRVSDTARYTSSFTPSTTAFTADSNTKLLIHSDFNGGIGADNSGNTNDFTPTNLAATDQVLDSPTNNFATLNPLWISQSNDSSRTFAEGNLKAATGASNWKNVVTTQNISSGKWYWECVPFGGNFNWEVGVCRTDWKASTANIGPESTGSYCVYCSGSGTGGTFVNGTHTVNNNYIWAANDILMVAYDDATGYFWLGKNGTWFNSGDPAGGSGYIFTVVAADRGDIYPIFAYHTNTAGYYINTGADSSFSGQKTAQGNTDGNGIGDFYYTPPTGFEALCSDNLSDPSIADPTAHFNTVLYTGDGTTSNTITTGLQPDLVWTYERNSSTGHHNVYDSVRGASKVIYPNLTNAEATSTGTQDLHSFNSTGFTIGTNYNTLINTSGEANVSWNWKCADSFDPTSGAPVTTASGKRNVDAGMAIIAWTGTGSNVTVGHGLSQAPELIINKSRGDAYNWAVQSFLWNSASDTNILYLNTTAAQADDTNVFQAAPTATVFSPQGGSWAGIGTNTIQYIAYCFHSVEGYSKVGSYEGNANADGPFVYTGFQPAFVIIKGADQSGSSWFLMDNKRDEYNVVDKELFADSSSAEGSGSRFVDFNSNGFKLRANDALNYASTMLYYAVAESPFKYSNAR